MDRKKIRMTTSLLKKSSDEKQMYFFGLGMIEIMQQTWDEYKGLLQYVPINLSLF